MKNPHKLFEAYLETHDGRYTTQKKQIADEIFKTRTHFEVEDFIDRLRKKNKLSRATVYRTIKQMLDANLLQKISTQDGKVYYEKITTKKRHDHVICNGCGKIQEINSVKVDQQLDQLCKALKFEPDYRSLHIYGLCDRCQKSQS